MADKRPNLKICIDNTEDQSDSESSSSGSDSDSDSESSGSSSPGSSSSSSSSDSGSSDSESEESGENDKPTVHREEMVLEVEDAPKEKKREPKRYENSGGEFVTGFDPLSEEFQTKRVERAKRFGIQTNVDSIDKEDVKELYNSLGIRERDLNNSGERGIRIEAVHLRGVNDMSTDDVFDFFKEFPAGSIEWIDDSSCNVVWQDPVTAARAMLQLSRSRFRAETDYLEESKKKTIKVVETKGGDSVEVENSTKSLEDDINLDKVEKQSENISQEEKTKPAESGDESMESEEESDGDDDDDLNLLSSDDETVVKQKKEKKLKKKKRKKKTDSEEKSMDVETEENEAKVKASPIRMAPSEDQEEMELGEIPDEEKELRKRTPTSVVPAFLECDTDLEPPSIPWPPGRWRLGKKHPKAEYLFLRFATKADKKLFGAEKRSKYYQKYGNPNYEGMKGVISGTRKRIIRGQRMRQEQEEARAAIQDHYTRPAMDPDDIPWEQLLEMHRSASIQKSASPGVKRKSKPPRSGPSSSESGSSSDSESESAQKVYSRQAGSAPNRLNTEPSDLDFFIDEGLNVDREELEQLLAPPPTKRYMRMHADDEEEEIEKRRVKEEQFKSKMKKQQKQDARHDLSERKQKASQRERSFLTRDFAAVETGDAGQRSQGVDLRNRLNRKRQHSDGRDIFSRKGLPRMRIEVEEDW